MPNMNDVMNILNEINERWTPNLPHRPDPVIENPYYFETKVGDKGLRISGFNLKGTIYYVLLKATGEFEVHPADQLKRLQEMSKSEQAKIMGQMKERLKADTIDQSL